MKAYITIILLTLLAGACSTTPKFEIDGTIQGAKGETVYLEKTALDATVLMDSAKLGSSGSFQFKGAKTSYPEFYRLRLGQQYINLAIDSTESVLVTAQKETFESTYQVNGSPICEQMRKLNQTATEVKSRLMELDAQLKAGKITQVQFNEGMKESTSMYKEVANPIILENPASVVAYFALFQRVFGYLIYDLGNRDDLKMFGAVATSFNSKYPDWPRSLNLYNMTLQAMKAQRQAGAGQSPIDLSQLNQMSAIDIQLYDYKGRMQKMAEVIKGKAAILSFTVYQGEFSPGLNILLNETYEKFKEKGLVIYQVSFDTDEHLFKTSASNLPWICVHDTGGPYSQLLTTYNVKQLPALFLLNKNGEIVKRIEDLKTLESETGKLL